ncbi:MAG: hypothetical protein RLO81_15590 [Fulvivirga sp.]|uniref:hypothetical protein n=1 Tax=Fulvivirga sp. TaxID=1931237 RepID=UPI0032F01FCE
MELEQSYLKGRRLRVIGGPNGSGKSTIIKEIQKNYDVGVYVNADVIEKKLKTSGHISLTESGIDKISNEEFKKFVKKHSLTQKAANAGFPIDLKFEQGKVFHSSKSEYGYEAALLADYLRHVLLSEGKKLTFETVMSHKSKIEILQRANKIGYKTYLYFISTKDPLINIERVNLRVKEGGHSVPKDKIEKRYYESLKLLKEAAKNTYRTFIWDNSGKQPELILEIYKGSDITYLSKTIPYWVQKYLLD